MDYFDTLGSIGSSGSRQRGTARRIPYLAGFESTYLPIHGQDVLEISGYGSTLPVVLQNLGNAGLKVIRYPLRWHRIEQKQGHFDWTFADRELTLLHELGFDPVVDLVHHTSYPDWLSDGFRDRRFGPAYLRYAEAVASRYSWLRHYTLFNEPFATLFLAGHEALWPPYDHGMDGFLLTSTSAAGWEPTSIWTCTWPSRPRRPWSITALPRDWAHHRTAGPAGALHEDIGSRGGTAARRPCHGRSGAGGRRAAERCPRQAPSSGVRRRSGPRAQAGTDRDHHRRPHHARRAGGADQGGAVAGRPACRRSPRPPPRCGWPVPAAEAVAMLREHVRPALQASGDETDVEALLAGLNSRGTGAAQQRAAAGSGQLRRAVAEAVRLTHTA